MKINESLKNKAAAVFGIGIAVLCMYLMSKTKLQSSNANESGYVKAKTIRLLPTPVPKH